MNKAEVIHQTRRFNAKPVAAETSTGSSSLETENQKLKERLVELSFQLELLEMKLRRAESQAA